MLHNYLIEMKTKDLKEVNYSAFSSCDIYIMRE